MFVASMVLLLFMLVTIIMLRVAPGAGDIVYLVYAGLGALVFSVVRA